MEGERGLEYVQFGMLLCPNKEMWGEKRMHVAERSLRHKDKETDHRVGAEEPGRSINMLNLLAYMTLPYPMTYLLSLALHSVLFFYLTFLLVAVKFTVYNLKYNSYNHTYT